MALPRPVVGVTCYEETASFASWELTAALLPARYVRALERAGASVLLVPPQRLAPGEAAGLCARLDGLVLAGGADVDPARYGAAAHPETVVAGGERDALELGLVTAAAEDGLPTLAICRGLQVLNVARGGSLVQHLPDVVGHDLHSPVRDGYADHDVRLVPGSRLASLLGVEEAGVPTHHHQAIDVLGDGLVATAHAGDGVIEAVEDPSLPFLLGVQWHPEVGADPSLFEALVAVAAERASRPGRPGR